MQARQPRVHKENRPRNVSDDLAKPRAASDQAANYAKAKALIKRQLEEIDMLQQALCDKATSNTVLRAQLERERMQHAVTLAQTPAAPQVACQDAAVQVSQAQAPTQVDAQLLNKLYQLQQEARTLASSVAARAQEAEQACRQLADVQQENNRLRSALSEAQQTAHHVHQDTAALHQCLHALKADNARLQSQVATAERDQQQRDQRSSTAAVEAQQATQQCADLQARLAEALKSNAELAAQLAETDEAAHQIERLAPLVTEKARECATVKRQLADCQAKLAEAQVAREALHAQLASAQTAVHQSPAPSQALAVQPSVAPEAQADLQQQLVSAQAEAAMLRGQLLEANSVVDEAQALMQGMDFQPRIALARLPGTPSVRPFVDHEQRSSLAGVTSAFAASLSSGARAEAPSASARLALHGNATTSCQPLHVPGSTGRAESSATQRVATKLHLGPVAMQQQAADCVRDVSGHELQEEASVSWALSASGHDTKPASIAPVMLSRQAAGPIPGHGQGAAHGCSPGSFVSPGGSSEPRALGPQHANPWREPSASSSRNNGCQQGLQLGHEPLVSWGRISQPSAAAPPMRPSSAANVLDGMQTHVGLCRPTTLPTRIAQSTADRQADHPPQPRSAAGLQRPMRSWPSSADSARLAHPRSTERAGPVDVTDLAAGQEQMAALAALSYGRPLAPGSVAPLSWVQYDRPSRLSKPPQPAVQHAPAIARSPLPAHRHSWARAQDLQPGEDANDMLHTEQAVGSFTRTSSMSYQRSGAADGRPLRPTGHVAEGPERPYTSQQSTAERHSYVQPHGCAMQPCATAHVPLSAWQATIDASQPVQHSMPKDSTRPATGQHAHQTHCMRDPCDDERTLVESVASEQGSPDAGRHEWAPGIASPGSSVWSRNQTGT